MYREAVCKVGTVFAAGSNLVGDLSSRFGNLIVADKPDNYSDYAFFIHDSFSDVEVHDRVYYVIDTVGGVVYHHKAVHISLFIFCILGVRCYCSWNITNR